jgi:hypothetical protein
MACNLYVTLLTIDCSTFVQDKVHEVDALEDSCSSNPDCLKSDVPLLKGIRRGLIDPDTPESAMTRKDINGKTQTLAFSDEFNDPGRTFYPGDDPYWLGMDFWYGVTMDLEVSFLFRRRLDAYVDTLQSGMTLMRSRLPTVPWPSSSMHSRTTT